MTVLTAMAPLAELYVSMAGGDYVALAYAVFMALILIYVGIMSAKLARIDREIGELAQKIDAGIDASEPANTAEDAPN